MRNKGYQTKKIEGKGRKKWRFCLGPDCTKKIFTTIETRLCLKCKRAMESTLADIEYAVIKDF